MKARPLVTSYLLSICFFYISYLYLTASHGIISAANKVDSNAGDDYRESYRRVCLISGNTDKELSVYILRPPEHLNGWLQHELSSIHSSLLISNDQEGEKIELLSYSQIMWLALIQEGLV